MKILIIVVIGLLIASCSQKYNPEITIEDIKNNINYLASDSLKGRKPGEAGDKLAADFIRHKFETAGLKLLYESGFQEFGLVTSAELGDENTLNINDISFQVETDFLPYAFSANTMVESKVVFAGYGLDVNKDTIQWNDFENLDVSGKWILALQGDPDMDNAQSPFVEFSTERSKALIASDKNAAGLILVAGPSFSSTDELSSLFFDKNSSRYSIPIIQITRKVADQILSETGETVASLEAKILEINTSVNLMTEANVVSNINVNLKETVTQNVVAMVPGIDEVLKNEYIVVGAHYDHLGMGGPGSGSRSVDTVAVHNGADDNASGVATVIELAEKVATEKLNKRSVIFAAFGAEEMGLVGSKAFTAEPPVETEKMVGMFNFDMVGRLDSASNALSIGGTKTAKEIEDLLNELNPGFQLAMSGEGIGPSDHASFYLQNIPVFFISTGAHSDYHTPNDDSELINFDGAKKVTDYAFSLVSKVASRDSALTFQEAGAKFQRSRGGRFKVTFGIMPDFAGLEKRGLRIDAVTKGKPADKGGMKKGDIITAIEGKKVGGIHDYMSRLQSLEGGNTITVDIIRDNKETVLIIQL
ncbi:MAG: M28 family peptidase [Prolixibacteraceae bacterium]|jgi:aminopeptidase YwaD|nr:M28 family peptidase [Prolixibacteraceae bacterium]MBT6767015.1 M28 family peptidase [Prolixibacteraceae bacterium]MBT6999404.1 M28 family peptidase [Prolixibacteraceae bacterium]MBT7394298.1 M28 family peptidase [Prolixibacteraceae bacterium]